VICALLGCYAGYIDSIFKGQAVSFLSALPSKVGYVCCPETSVTN